MDTNAEFLTNVFISSDSNEVCKKACEFLLGLSMSKEFLSEIEPQIMRLIGQCCKKLSDDCAADLLVNLTAYLASCEKQVQWDTVSVSAVINGISRTGDLVLSRALSNMLRCVEEPVDDRIQQMVIDEMDNILDRIISDMADSLILCNLTAKCPLVRRHLWEDIVCRELFLQTIEYKSNGLLYSSAAVRNCCLDTALHDEILKTDGVIVQLVLPLLDYCFEILPEENEKLPCALQYPAPDKHRETNPETRKNLLESLYLLCATRQGRAKIRDSNVYYLLRELFNVENEEDVKEACLNVINVIIADEPAHPSHSNLMGVEVPSELVSQFEQIKEQTK